MENKKYKEIKDLSICISDNQGKLYDLDEIVSELIKFYDDFDTHSMNEYILYKIGQKHMIHDIIWYLKRIIGEDDEEWE